MTKLLEQALTTVSTRLSKERQDRLAHLMIGNLNRLEEVLEDALEEQAFEASAIRALESKKVRDLLKRAAEKHRDEVAPIRG